ncbi:MAG TPA: tetratricopeptide repeat protein, partial [Candidatus Acidoferrales bacterium]|nr:tetratricopeptide repeat protein [Candidatus Acidoferrales bacterium]
GETLAQRIRRGALSPAEAADVAIQMARGLAEAHGRKIVHRDIKPSNVILTSQNVAKIVDFGLARVVGGSTATQSLGIAGTVAYMSPEQAMGREVDQRSDIWSLGIVLDEMLTGRHPFQRDTLTAVMVAIVNQPPASLEGVPPELQQIIYRALAKDPAKRYQSCAELLADLEKARSQVRAFDAAPTESLRPRDLAKYVQQASTSPWLPAAPRQRRWQWWLATAALLVIVMGVLLLVQPLRERIAGAVSGNSEKHIAVLPFDNIGNDSANEPVAEGLMESLTSRLSNLDVGQQSLWVVPASVVRRRKVDDPSLALRDLGATLVVKGTIQRQGQDVRLTLNLINAKTLRLIGSVGLEDRAGDLATLQDEAVARLARLMNIAVTPEMLKATGGKVNPAAYEGYLKALGYIERYDKPGNLDTAIGALEGAVKTDPQFALGFAELGEAYRLKYRLDQNPKWIDEASANCQRAEQLSDRLPAVYVTLGRIHDDMGKHDLALQEYQHALQLNPRDADALNGMAHAYESAGRLADAESAFKKTAAMRPDYWDGYNTLALFYDRRGRNQEALAQYRRAAELTPDNAQVYSNMGASYFNTGDPKLLPEAENAFRKSIELTPSYPAYANLGYLYLREGRYAESAAMTEKALALNDKNFQVWANLALAYGWLKQNDKAAAARERELRIVEETAKVQAQNPKLQSALAILYAQKKLRDKALTRIEAALALAPDNASVLADVGQAYEALGDRRQALHYVTEALRMGYKLDYLKLVPDLKDLLADPNFRPKEK